MKKLSLQLVILSTSIVIHMLLIFLKVAPEPQPVQKKQVLKYKQVGKIDRKDKGSTMQAFKQKLGQPILNKEIMEKISRLLEKERIPIRRKNPKKREINKQISKKKQFSFEAKKIQAEEFYKIKGESDHKKILDNKFMGLDIIPPQGVSQDELNTLEKKFYSFQKRVFKNYLYSFLRVYKQLSLDRPALIKEVESGRYRLRGKIIYDEDGSIISLKIIKSSFNDNIHLLFERTLKQMNYLSNPPKELLDQKREIPIFFNLNIN